MKAVIEGMRPGEPVLTDSDGRRVALVLKLVPETTDEVAELKRFCRLTDAFTFVIDEEYRLSKKYTAPVYGERTFAFAHRVNEEELR